MAATVDVSHTSFLVNLGLKEVQDWVIDLVDQYAAKGMKWFRHDFNMDPLEIWRNADANDRQGINEIRYIEGLYRIYEEIHQRHPDVIIEGCASGGRRIDIESISRNHGYFATDMMCGTPEPMQAHISGFNHYLLPQWHNTVLQLKNCPKEDSPQNRYQFFSFIGGAPCIGADLSHPDINTKLSKQWIEKFKEIRHLTQGDFYPLSEWSLSKESWYAVQFHRHDLKQGLVAFFRRPNAPYDRAEFSLRGLEQNTNYQFNSIFDDEALCVEGSEASRKFSVELKHTPDVKIFIYQENT